jgi:hypothetical protein
MKRIPLVSIAFSVCLMSLPVFAAAPGPVDRSLPEYTGIPYPTLKPWAGRPAAPAGLMLWDDFNRPDGPLGPDWTVQAATFMIVSQAAVGSGGPALATHNSATGDAIEIDVAHNGAGVQFAAAVLNYGGGSSDLFLKVQDNGSGQLDNAACYLGNNGSGGTFGLAFFPLTAPFMSAHMRVEVDAARNVTINFTNVDGGAGAPQQYVCASAPPAEGPAVGIGGFGGLASIDNFASGPVPVELMGFTVE